MMMRLVVAFLACFVSSADAFALPHGQELHDAVVLLQHSGAAFVHTGAAFIQHAASSYQDSLHQHPLLTKMVTGGALATAGDAIAQSKNAEPYDKRRALSFMTFDMCYRALQHVAFPIIVSQCHGQYLGELLSNTPLVHHLQVDHLAAMEQTLASQLGIVPFIYYPVFYALTAAIQNLTPEAALNRAKETFLPLMSKNLKFWIPVQFIQFGFIDEQLQIPFLSTAGLCWTVILSLAAGSAKRYNQEEPVAALAVEEESQDSYPYTAQPRATVSS
jgi:hypothetical protein